MLEDRIAQGVEDGERDRIERADSAWGLEKFCDAEDANVVSADSDACNSDSTRCFGNGEGRGAANVEVELVGLSGAERGTDDGGVTVQEGINSLG